MAEKNTKNKRLVLLDAHAIIHRAYHALPEFSSSKGEPTGALYGLSAMLLKIIDELKPDYLVACYDLPEPTYRHEAYEAYKAGRAKADDELAAQLDRSRDVFKAFGVPIYEHAGFEADDILGTIVEQVRKNPPAGGLDIIIASGDMDTLQLVSKKKVQVYTLKKGIRDTILYDEQGVEERFDFPPKLLPDFKGLRGDPSDNIIGIPGIGEKTATELIVSFGSIEKIYATLKKNSKALEKAGIKPRVVKLLEEHEEEARFSKMLAEIRRDAPIDYALPKRRFEEALDVDTVLALFSELNFRTLADRVKRMFKTTSSFLEAEAEAEAVPEAELKETAVALWLISSDTTSPAYDDILAYAGTDSWREAREHIFAKLKELNLERIYTDIERPLIPVITKMEERGVLIDTDYLKKLSKEYHRALDELEKKIHEHVGESFNINSPKQLGDALFEKLHLKPKNQKRTGTGQKSTRESELEKMRDDHPIIGDVLDYRELQKLLSTYIDNLPGMVGEDGRLHAEFLQSGTTTGRLSSKNPNLQNIPIRTELGRKIRNAFIATEGFSLISLDYSQIELRIAAFISGDEKLIEVFKARGDVHRAVAAEVFNVPSEQVDAEMRRRAKAINFGILYGMGVNALMAAIGTGRAEAQAFYNEYFKRFPGLARYMSDIKAEAARTGYTTTLWGRKRWFEGIRSSLPHVRAAAERMAINAPIQGTQADLIKLAMVRIDTYIEEQNLAESVYLLLQVHDELVYEVRDEKLDEISRSIKSIMESILTPEETEGVPILVETRAGKSWGEMESI
jgi:DNA polymerase-1